MVDARLAKRRPNVVSSDTAVELVGSASTRGRQLTSERRPGMARTVGGCIATLACVRACTRTRVAQDRIPPTAPEVTAMDAKGEQTAFVYTTYIQETPERVWRASPTPR